MIGAAIERPPVFSALIVAGVLVATLVAVIGRNPVTEAIAAAYLALILLAVLRQAL